VLVNKLLSRPAFIGWLLLILLPLYGPYMPSLEGKLLPVTSKLHIEKVERQGDQSVIYVSFNKLRDCRFIGLTWYQGDRRLSIRFLDKGGDSDPSRQVGPQLAGPWVISTTSLAGSKVIVSHQCHPFWETRTIIFP